MLNIDQLKEILPLVEVDGVKVFFNVDLQLKQAQGYDGVLTALENAHSIKYPLVIIENDYSGTFEVLPGGLDTTVVHLWILNLQDHDYKNYAYVKKIMIGIIQKLVTAAQSGELDGLQLDNFRYVGILEGESYGYDLMLTFKDGIELYG